VNEKTLNLLVLALVVFLVLRGSDSEPIVDPIDPPPFPSADLSVLIVEESSQRAALPYKQLSVLTSLQIRDYVTESGGEIRVWDKDVDAEYEAEKWRDALSKPRDSLPWIYIANGDKGYSGPLPKDVDKTKELIGKYK